MKKKNSSIIGKETGQILKKCWCEIFLKFIISFLYRGVLLAIPILWGRAIDLVTNGDYESAYRIIFITLILSVAYYICACLNQVVYYILYNKMYKLYSNTTYRAIINNSLYSLSRFKLGEFSNIVNTDIDIVVAFLSDLIIKIVRILEFLIIYYYFYTINFNLFIITVIISLSMVGIFLLTGKRTKELNQKRKRNLDKKFAITHEVFNTVKEIKGFYIFKNINERVNDIGDKYLNSNTQYHTFSVVVKQIILAIIEVARYGFAIYGAYLCSIGQMEVGTILVIYTYYGKVIENYDIIGTLMIGLEDFKVSQKRLNKLLEYQVIAQNLHFLAPKEYQGNIKFEDVLYGDKKDPILNKVSLTIKGNSITAITGNPGTGKTGIFDLLMKMNRKHKGKILIDGDSYESINDEIYYNLVSLVRKEPHFFDLSIKDNLLLISDNFDRVKKVCMQIGIHDEIMQLKNNYNTMVNDVSAKISNSLKIGIAIARVLLKDSKIMMFDETINMLDIRYKENVLSILKELSKDHTIIMITRDEDLIKISSKIITFESNKIKKVRLVKPNSEENFI